MTVHDHWAPGAVAFVACTHGRAHLAVIPGGWWRMGCPDCNSSAASPRLDVALDGFRQAFPAFRLGGERQGSPR